MVDRCTVSGLHSYPVKSCRGVAVESSVLSPLGLAGDRQLMVLLNGKPANQARLPALATVAARWVDAINIEVQVGGETRQERVAQDGGESTIEYYGNSVQVVDQGDDLAELLSTVIGEGARVVALKEPYRRAVPLEEFALVDGTLQEKFVDVAPLLVTSEASLADLNARLDEPVPMNRFRPNIVIEGLGAYAEDDFVGLQGDGWRLLRATHCERCATTCTDQETGARTTQPLATLKSYRHREPNYAGGVLFGAYMAVEGEGTIRLGDELKVLTS